jgi:hypothetical protein
MAVTEATAKAVAQRDRVCRYCFGREYEPGPGPQWRYVIHHIAPKGMGGIGDELLRAEGDQPERLVLLHDFCHRQVHERPRKARLLGLLESRLGKVRPSALIRRPA